MRKFRWILPLLLVVLLVLSVPAAQAKKHTTKGMTKFGDEWAWVYAELDDTTGEFTEWGSEINGTGIHLTCTKIAEGDFYPGSCINEPSRSITLSVEYKGQTYEKTLTAKTFPLGHIWDQDWTIDIENETHYHKCLREGCMERKDEKAHAFSLIRYDENSHWEECVCGLKGTESQPHNWSYEIGVDDLIGFHSRECTTCKYAEESIPHQYEPTYVDEEYHMWKCVCGAEKPETKAEPHDYVLTDVGEGYHMWKCACGAVKPETDAEPHKYGNWTPVEDTDTHIGTCACGAETNESHEWGEWLSVDPYSHQRNCTMCGAFESESHLYENGVCTVCERECTHEGGKATCVAKAVCDLCGLEYGDFDLTNHDLTHHDAKPATCTEDGWPAYDTCKREGCNYTTLLMMQARLGHDLTHHEGKAATCTEAGWEAYDTCKREGCDYTTYKEIPALGHDLVKHDAKAPTCTEAGWDAYDTCSRCSYTTYREIAAPGHIPGEPVVTAREEPQVGKAGFEETIICCTVCGLELEYSYNQLPALPEPVPDKKEETTGKPDAEIAIAPKKSVLRIIQPEFLEEEQELELSVIQQIFSDDSGVYFQTEPDSVLPNIPPYALKLIEAKVWRLEKYPDLADRVSLDYTGSQEFPLNLDLIMILVYRDDAGEHWEVLKKPTSLGGSHLRVEVDAALMRKLQSRPFAIIVLADNGSR